MGAQFLLKLQSPLQTGGQDRLKEAEERERERERQMQVRGDTKAASEIF